MGQGRHRSGQACIFEEGTACSTASQKTCPLLSMDHHHHCPTNCNNNNTYNNINTNTYNNKSNNISITTQACRSQSEQPKWPISW